MRTNLLTPGMGRTPMLRLLIGLMIGLSFYSFTESAVAEDDAVRPTGSRLELIADESLFTAMSGEVRRVLHHPTPREVVVVHDEPWEGSGCGYHSVFQDGDRYRMYYKAWQLTIADGALKQPHPLYACYAESDDGIHWRKPTLGLVEFDGSSENNIILAGQSYGEFNSDPGHIAVFKDDNPQCDPDARYKAIVRSSNPNGLLAFGSADGIRFRLLADRRIVTAGAFDSQNLAFWDADQGKYRMYFRVFSEGRRDIQTCTSDDFLSWSEAVLLEYPGASAEHLYTNQIKPYHRAPHLLIGFPTRYIERGWSPSMRQLPDLAHREARSAVSNRHGMALTEGLLMTSSDRRTFHRWAEAFLRPGAQRADTWAYGNQYIAWHLVETAADVNGAPNELSLYASEGYWTGESNRLRRYTLRLDGFVSLQASMQGGEAVTAPLRFEGERLTVNFATSAAGSLAVEIQDIDGRPIPGYELEQCVPQFGDEIERTVSWKGGADVSALAGQTVRLRFQLKDADLYAFRFAAND